MQYYDVIIIGGGPVGKALGIELGMFNINAVIIEKYTAPLMLPRAQLLNPRSMEFFRRWGISQTLIKRKILPDNYPLCINWCSGLTSKVYSSVNISENIAANISPEKYQRIPLWITEDVMREHIRNFSNVKYINNYEAVDIDQKIDDVTITIKNRIDNQVTKLKSSYVVACDGANSSIRNLIGIKMRNELAPLRMINTVFKAKNLISNTTVPKGILYYNLTLPKPGALGLIDYHNDLWYSLIASPGTESIDQIDISGYLDEIAGFAFEKDILQKDFWNREAKIAETFRDKRIFLAGDAAHVHPPNGGHGLNTGLGDALNLAWKLAAVINKQAEDSLLDTYEQERYPTAIFSINTAKKNAEDAAKIYEQFPPKALPEEFARENARIAKQHSISPGLSLGYGYNNYPKNPSLYQPKALPGFFAPHCIVENDKSIYDILFPCYTLLITDKKIPAETEIVSNVFRKKFIDLKIILLSKNELYSKKFYLIRPDWHIAWCGDNIYDQFENNFNFI